MKRAEEKTPITNQKLY